MRAQKLHEEGLITLAEAILKLHEENHTDIELLDIIRSMALVQFKYEQSGE